MPHLHTQLPLLWLRPAAAADAKILSQIHAQSWRTVYRGLLPDEYLDSLPDDHWEIALSLWLKEGSAQAMLLMNGKENVGCTVYRRSQDPQWPGCGEVLSVYLLPEYMDRSWGPILMDGAFYGLRLLGYKRVFLWAPANSPRAKKFCESQGLTATGEEAQQDLKGAVRTLIRLWKPL